MQLKLTATQGRLGLAQTTGLSFVTGNGSDDASMSFTGSVAAINAALDGLVYRPNAGYIGADTVQFVVNDLGNGGGAAKIVSADLAMDVTATNDAPTIDAPGPQGTGLPTPLAFSAVNGNAIRVDDIDAGNAALELTLRTDALGNGTLTLGSSAGLTLVSGTGSGDTLMVLRGSRNDLNAALDTLVFDAGALGAARIDLSIDDLGNSGAGPARQALASVDINVGANLLPVLNLSRAGVGFTENDAPLVLDPALVLDDQDHATLASARVRFSSGYVAAEDELLFVNDGLTMGNISGGFAGGTLTLGSAGASATLAEWQSALRSVAYRNLSESPDVRQRVFAWSINDSIADSMVRSLSMDVAALNDAPVLGGVNALVSIDEGDTGNAGTLVGTLIAGHVSDVDAGASTGIAVTAADTTQGSWQYSLDAGLSWLPLDVVSDASARLLAADNLVRFVPSPDWNGTLASALTLRAWDQTSGLPGERVSTAVNGGVSAFSSASVSTSLVVRALNDAPVLSGANNFAAVAEDTAATATVADLIAGFYSDADDHDPGIAVVAADGANGRWLYSTDAGANWLALGAVDDSAARLLGTDALLRFVPDADWNGSADLRFRAWDRSTGSSGDSADTRVNGGGSAYGAVVRASTATVTAVNDAPRWVDALADAGATQGSAFDWTLPAGSFVDVDAGDVLSVRATLASGAALPGWLNFDAASGRFSGTPANADVATLVVRVTVTDLAGESVSNDFVLDVANLNDAPVAVGSVADVSTEATRALFVGLPPVLFTDIDVGDVLSYTLSRADGGLLPGWLRFDAGRFELSGTPLADDAGRYALKLVATDSAGAQAALAFELVVTPLPAPAPAPTRPTPTPAPAPAPVLVVALVVADARRRRRRRPSRPSNPLPPPRCPPPRARPGAC